MNKSAQSLPSIRSRIVVSFVVFGAVVSILSIVAVVVSTEAPAGVLILILIAGIIAFVGWQASTLLTRDVRQLARAVDETDPDAPQAQELPPRSFQPMSRETAELAEALHRYSTHIKGLTGNLASEVNGCRLDVTEATGTLSDFMYYIAHVLRTPVNAIRWSVESLKNEDEGAVSEGQREVLDTLEASAVKLASVASELQDALLVIRGEPIHMRPGNCDIPALIDVAAGKMAVQLRRKNLTLIWQHPEKPPPPVRCDPERVAQVATVLLDNAAKYTPPGHSISIEMHLVGLEGASASLAKSWGVPETVRQSVVVSVEDQGIGIAKKEQDRIFRAFFRGEEARELWVDGKGVGLMLAKAIIEGCGGQMWFVSHKGRGTAMRFSIPIIPS